MVTPCGKSGASAPEARMRNEFLESEAHFRHEAFETRVAPCSDAVVQHNAVGESAVALVHVFDFQQQVLGRPQPAADLVPTNFAVRARAGDLVRLSGAVSRGSVHGRAELVDNVARVVGPALLRRTGCRTI